MSDKIGKILGGIAGVAMAIVLTAGIVMLSAKVLIMMYQFFF
ncbi:hypothetical protein [Companilactobacillus sp.]|nr:hypothetical protein [Companilactobacillus sp.]